MSTRINIKRTASGIGLVAIALLFVSVVDLYNDVQAGRTLARDSAAYHAPDPDADFRILVAGDSTAVGTGASDSRYSTAGRLHVDFPDASLENIAFNGATVSQVRDQFRSLRDPYDLILLQVGANDIAFFRELENSVRDLDSLLGYARGLSDTVVFLVGGNASLAPGLMFPIDQFYGRRAHVFLQAFQPIAAVHDVHYVDLYTSAEDNPFKDDTERFYAEDLLHLSDDGYGVWYDEIRKKLVEIGVLAV